MRRFKDLIWREEKIIGVRKKREEEGKKEGSRKRRGIKKKGEKVD